MDPVLAGSLAYALGIRTGLEHFLPVQVWIGALGLGAILTFAAWKKEWSRDFYIGLFLVCIFCAGTSRGTVEKTAAQRMAQQLGRTGRFTGRVVPGSIREGRHGNSSFLLEEQKGRIRVFVQKSGRFRPGPGIVQVTGVLKPVDGFFNPGMQDPEVGAAIRKEGGRIQTVGNGCRFLSRDPSWMDQIQTVGNKLRGQLRCSMGNADSALLEGMLLGGSSQIEPETLQMFQRCGLSHLLSVSGSHVALLMGLFTGAVQYFRIPRKAAVPFGVLLLSGYAVLCGLRASVCRAVILGAGVLLGKAGRRRAKGTAFLGLAAILLLSWNPWWCRDPGFQLSFTAALGLMTLRKPVSEKLDVFLPRPVAGGLSVPISAQLLSLPFLVIHFHTLSLVSLLANVLLVPVLSLCVTGSAIGAILGSLGLILPGRPVLAVVSQLMGFALWGGEKLAQLPGTHLVTGQVPLWGWPLYFLLIGAVLEKGWFQPFRPRLRRGTILAAGFGLGALVAFCQFCPQAFTVYFLDVGQGDCAVVITPEREIIVVDTGGLPGRYDTGERILVPFLRWLGADRVDLLILSHGHLDHAGGAAALSRWFPIYSVALPPDLWPSAPDLAGEEEIPTKEVAIMQQVKQFGQLNKIVYKMQTNQKICKKGSIIQIVEAPTIQKKGGEKNENSAIVRVSCGAGSVLFTGDAPAEGELAAARWPIGSDVLKVSHHGSRTSSSEGFLAAVSPRLAVISSGRENRFGHPHPEILERLERFHIPCARTDRGGAIKVVFDGSGPVWYNYRWQRDFF